MYLELPAPTNVKATALSSNSVEVTWDQSSGATGYAISYTTTDKRSVIVKSDSKISRTLNDLKDDTDYTITVQGTTNGDEKGVESDKVSVKTPKFGKRCKINIMHTNLTL